MCGIIASIRTKNVLPEILSGLRLLEYRGYDSAGIAGISKEVFVTRKTIGPTEALQNLVEKAPLPQMNNMIGHTRWATHGPVSQANTHPQMSNAFALVHNGIISNFEPLKKELQKEGFVFQSTTDTEVIVFLLEKLYKETGSLQKTLHKTYTMLSGSFAFVAIHKDHPNKLLAASQESPLVISQQKDGYRLASDVTALLDDAQSFHHMQSGSFALISTKKIEMYQGNETIPAPFTSLSQSAPPPQKGAFAHHMLKEIHEQPRTLSRLYTQDIWSIESSFLQAQKEKNWHIIACGSSYHAGLIGSQILGTLGVFAQTFIASEWSLFPQSSCEVALFISQSGETADVLKAAKKAKEQGTLVLSLCNEPNSSLARISDRYFPLNAGKEIGVASTKAFTNQILALFCMARTCSAHPLPELPELQNWFDKLIQYDFSDLVQRAISAKNIMIIGRQHLFPVALEGALKLNELTYRLCGAFPFGELKHGPLALVDPNTLVLCLVNPETALKEKCYTNIYEILSRHGQVFMIGEQDNHPFWEGNHLSLPSCPYWITPILYTIPLQLFAYHTALAMGLSIDKPRNLAKSVTVE